MANQIIRGYTQVRILVYGYILSPKTGKNKAQPPMTPIKIHRANQRIDFLSIRRGSRYACISRSKITQKRILKNKKNNAKYILYGVSK